MSEAILALPNVSLFKNEVPLDKVSNSEQTSPTFDEGSQSNSTDRLFKYVYDNICYD